MTATLRALLLLTVAALAPAPTAARTLGSAAAPPAASEAATV
jgi:hypothetical protein